MPTAGQFTKEQDAAFHAQTYNQGYPEYAKARLWQGADFRLYLRNRRKLHAAEFADAFAGERYDLVELLLAKGGFFAGAL